jgi:hypothetical protein
VISATEQQIKNASPAQHQLAEELAAKDYARWQQEVKEYEAGKARVSGCRRL